MKNIILKASFASIMLAASITAQAQNNLWDFKSIKPGPQTQALQLPPNMTFQMLVTTGTVLSDGSTMGAFPDFTGFVPKNGSSESGHISINSEASPGGVSVHELNFDTTTNTWKIISSGTPSFTAVGGSGFNCSGGVTPWGTVVTVEEPQGIPLAQNNLDQNLDGYADFGWATEIDVVKKSLIDYDNNGVVDKIWASGRIKGENVCFSTDHKIMYKGADDSGFGFIYKFIMDVPEKLGAGKLYFLKADKDMAGNFIGTGTWVLMPNTTQAERNTTQATANSMGATNFNRVEDVEVGPDGKLYFTATSPGHVYRFNDDGMSVSGLEIFIKKGKYAIASENSIDTALFEKCDNLAFDPAGNLWITEDGVEFYLWVVGKNHTASQPDVRIFMNTPKATDDPSGNVAGAECTGLTFSPDGRFGFLSYQRASSDNLGMQTDAAGNMVNHNMDMTFVIGHKGILGKDTTFTQDTTSMDTTATNAIRAKFLNNRFNVYPNPANRIVNIDFTLSTTEPLTIQIYNIQGKIIGSQNFNGQAGTNLIKFDTFLYPQGTYTVIITNGKEQVAQKLIVKE